MTEPPALPPLDAKTRRALRARGNRLRARMLIGRKGLSDAIVAQLRCAFDKSDLVKVRVETDDRGEADSLGEAIAVAVPCHVVGRVGRVLLLHRPTGAIAS
jgi:RNA-binding protein